MPNIHALSQSTELTTEAYTQGNHPAENSYSHELVKSYIPLAAKLAWQYHSSFNQADFDDIFQGACIGLIDAAARFDSSRNANFATYAIPWIRKHIFDEYWKMRWTIRPPERVWRQMQTKRKVQARLHAMLFREPTKEEVVIALAEQESLDMGGAQALIDATYIAEADVISLDMPVGQDQEAHLVDFIEDRQGSGIEDETTDVFLSELVSDLLDALSPTEKDVILKRFYNGMTLSEIGGELGVSRQRIKQIENQALRKLRHPTRSRQMRDYLE